MKTPWPDLFIVGAAKTGTSSMYQYLIQHPDVARSVIKEPHFFATDIDITKFDPEFLYHKVKDIDEAIRRNKVIHSSFIRDEADYLKLYAQAGDKLKVDSSVSNLFSRVAAKNIFEKNPQAHIVIIIRQPVERAFSHYVMDRRSGYKISEYFTEAVFDDYRKSNKGWGISHLYVELSLYADAIKRYLEVFPPHQIKIIVYDDYKKDSIKILHEIVEWLQLTSFTFNTERSHNTAALPSNVITRWLNRNKDLKRSISQYIPEKWRHTMRSIAYTKKNLPRLIERDFELLMPLFREDILKTEQLTGLNLNHWKKLP